jgi:hypothetical protein
LFAVQHHLAQLPESKTREEMNPVSVERPTKSASDVYILAFREIGGNDYLI